MVLGFARQLFCAAKGSLWATSPSGMSRRDDDYPARENCLNETSPSGMSRRDDDYLANDGRWFPGAFEPASHRSAGPSPTGAESRY
jgi:hypothetical protein